MFLDVIEFKMENKQKILGKTVYKLLLQICETVAYWFTKLLLEKLQKLKRNKKLKTMKASTIFGGYWRQN